MLMEIGLSPVCSVSPTPGVVTYLQTKTLPALSARAALLLGPTSARPTMLATASQPALRNVVARFRRRMFVSIDLPSPTGAAVMGRE
jgi:hypothetical protein